jgi:sec-independent protein translocase protein TatC
MADKNFEEKMELARRRVAEKMEGMSFLAHLEELRRRIIYAALFVVAGFCACWYWADKIFGFMMVPITDALKRNNLPPQLVYLNPTEPFNLYMKVGLMAGLIVASPFVLYQVWAFVAPGLYRNEKRYVLPFMGCTVFLFLAGAWFGYKMVYPAALDFLVGYGKQFQPMITIGEYTSLFLTIIVGLGIIFELPILAFFLALMGVISAKWMWKNFRYAFLACFVVAAIVTPTTDIMNMCLFAAPMVVLYAISIFVAWLVHPSRRRKRAEAAAAKSQGQS